jgi:hypothetical protein
MKKVKKYKKLRYIDYFPISFSKQRKQDVEDEDLQHKYDGHRYIQRRRYNFLSQQNRRNQQVSSK